MLKQGFLVSCVLALSVGMARANTAPYVGASLGVSTNTTDSTARPNSRGVPLSVLAGYGGVITQSVYLAGEVTGTLATGQLSANGMKSTYGYGVSLLPGVMLHDHFLAFARVGVVRTNFNSGNNLSTGAEAGLGMQTSLTQNVELRGEYDFTAYHRVSTVGASPKADAFLVSLVYLFN
ncbi:MAG: hypothetical protein A3E85_03980 [Gammaproteobacteria bacterium RIFCSPHIGHO2_12_FULL_45_12]|nr:MAG: hypothetical protein A3E85_03980 [Gammaproteobacteria bacterium RIFCSPHIGHO2_12_FULL_45_12]